MPLIGRGVALATGPRKTIASNFVRKVETRICIAASAWPVEGQEAKQPTLNVRKGEQVILAGEVEGGFCEGFTEHDPDRMGWFKASCIDGIAKYA